LGGNDVILEKVEASKPSHLARWCGVENHVSKVLSMRLEIVCTAARRVDTATTMAAVKLSAAVQSCSLTLLIISHETEIQKHVKMVGIFIRSRNKEES
jgi:hypothetical protein